jgi:cyanophycinase
MTHLFLIGGGRNEASYVRTYWRFVLAATKGGRRRIAIVIPVDASHGADERKELEEDARDPFLMFEPIKKDETHVLLVSRDDPLTAAKLQAIDATGVYVSGSTFGACKDALCTDRSWLDHLRETGMPYAGHSTGTAIASERAIAGGWLIALRHFNCEVASDKLSCGTDFAELTDGLGLAPFSIEVRATQVGTLSRLVHLVAEGMIPGGWAIDENNMVEIEGDELRIHGPNSAYRVRPLGEGAVRTDIFHGGAVLDRRDW